MIQVVDGTSVVDKMEKQGSDEGSDPKPNFYYSGLLTLTMPSLCSNAF